MGQRGVGLGKCFGQHPGEAVPQLAGVRVSNIEPGMPSYGMVEGVIITRIEPKSPGAQTGLHPGDVIYGVNRTRVRSVPETSMMFIPPMPPTASVQTPISPSTACRP